jgi:hypothetical protein
MIGKYFLLVTIIVGFSACGHHNNAGPSAQSAIATQESLVASKSWCEVAGDDQNGGRYTVYQYKFTQGKGDDLNTYQSKEVLLNDVNSLVPSANNDAAEKTWVVKGDGGTKSSSMHDFTVQIEPFSNANVMYLSRYKFSFGSTPTSQLVMRNSETEWLAFPCENVRPDLAN